MTLFIKIDHKKRQDLENLVTPENEPVMLQIDEARGDLAVVLLPVIGPQPIVGRPDKITLFPKADGSLEIAPLAMNSVAQTSMIRVNVYDYTDPEPYFAASFTIDLLPVDEPHFWPGRMPPEVVVYKGELTAWQFDPLLYSGAGLSEGLLTYQGEDVTYRLNPVTFQA